MKKCKIPCKITLIKKYKNFKDPKTGWLWRLTDIRRSYEDIRPAHSESLFSFLFLMSNLCTIEIFSPKRIYLSIILKFLRIGFKKKWQKRGKADLHAYNLMWLVLFLCTCRKGDIGYWQMCRTPFSSDSRVMSP